MTEAPAGLLGMVHGEKAEILGDLVTLGIFSHGSSITNLQKWPGLILFEQSQENRNEIKKKPEMFARKLSVSIEPKISQSLWKVRKFHWRRREIVSFFFVLSAITISLQTKSELSFVAWGGFCCNKTSSPIAFLKPLHRFPTKIRRVWKPWSKVQTNVSHKTKLLR